MNHFKELAVNSLSAAIGNGKEAAWGASIAAIGVSLSNLLGGWDMALKVLLLLMVGDYVTGMLGAIRQRKVNSEVMYWGGIRKAVVLFVVGLASLLDDWIQPGAPIFRTAAIYYYAGREGVSVVENLGDIGVPLPKAIKDFLEQLAAKGDEADASKTSE